MKRSINILTILALFVTLSAISIQNANATSGTATVPLAITVNGAVTVTDTADTVHNPGAGTLDVSFSVSPDVGASDLTSTKSFRVRTNYTMWKLTGQRAGFSAGATALAATDIGLTITKTAGSNAVAGACTLQSPFTGATTINAISASSATDICAGTSAKTAAARSSSANANNYLQFDTLYTLAQDFFFEPGSASDTITYTVANY